MEIGEPLNGIVFGLPYIRGQNGPHALIMELGNVRESVMQLAIAYLLMVRGGANAAKEAIELI